MRAGMEAPGITPTPDELSLIRQVAEEIGLDAPGHAGVRSIHTPDVFGEAARRASVQARSEVLPMVNGLPADEVLGQAESALARALGGLDRLPSPMSLRGGMPYAAAGGLFGLGYGLGHNAFGIGQ
jgi:hypothetical protein